MFAKQMHRFIALALWALPTLVFAEDKPKVVIFYTDDQGTLDARCYGSEHLVTPNLDKLAAKLIDMNVYQPGFDRDWVKRFKAMVLAVERPMAGSKLNWDGSL